MSDADDYESLPDSTPLSVSVLAGATAGVAEHCVMFPVDSVKTRMQSLMCHKQHNTMLNVMRTMVQEEGLLRPIKGMNAMALGAGPAHAMYFTALEKVKEAAHHRGGISEHAAGGLSAVLATMLHDAFMTPAEVVKQRMQMCCSPFKSCTQATMAIYQAEGLRAFYRSYFTQLTMNVPFQAAVVVSYGMCQKMMNPKKEYNPAVHFVAGAVAGAVGSALTMPLDVCKTLLNTQEAGVLTRIHQTEVVGMMGAASVIHRMTGFSGFFQGLSARVLYQAPSTAVAWSVYEFFKAFLQKSSEGETGYENLSDLKTNVDKYEPALGDLRPQLPQVLAADVMANRQGSS